jgi:hypothetical protein
MLLPQSVREEVLRRSNGRCSICGREIDSLVVDHVVPRSRGGTDALDNLEAVCRSCNVLKTSNPSSPAHSLKEKAVASYSLERQVVEFFERAGYAVISGITGRDAGVDLVVRRDTPFGVFSLIVQCKSSTKPVSYEEVADFIRKVQQQRGSAGFLVVDKKPTLRAVELAKSYGVRVLTIEEMNRLGDEFSEAGDG